MSAADDLFADLTPGQASTKEAASADSLFSDLPRPSPGIARKTADLVLEGTRAGYGAIGAFGSAFGADNPIAVGSRAIAEEAGNLQSPHRQAQRQQEAQRMEAAEQSGDWKQEVGAAWQNFKEAPAAHVAGAVGSAVPTVAAALAGAALGPVAAVAAPVGLGGAIGAGSVKSSIYEDVKRRHLAAGMSEADAEARAVKAQDYRGDNLDQIALGAGIGAVAGGTGLERIAPAGAAGGIVRRAVSGALTEAVPEAIQGGQERVAANLAAQREGFDAPTWQGVAGQATTEGLAGGALGGMAGAARPAPSKQMGIDPAAGPLSNAAAQAVDNGVSALPAPHQVSGGYRASASATPTDETMAETADQVAADSRAARAAEESRRAALDPAYLDSLNGTDAEFAEMFAQERGDLDARRAAGPWEELKGVDAGFDPAQRLRNQVPDAPRGSLSQVNELADLIAGEQSDLAQRREQAAQTQQADLDALVAGEAADLNARYDALARQQGERRAIETADADQRTADARAREAEQRRRAVLDSVLADPAVTKHAERFAAELQRQGYRDAMPTEGEQQRIARFNDLVAAEPVQMAPEIEPATPNELDAAALGIRERRAAPEAVQPAPAARWAAMTAEDRAAVAGGTDLAPVIRRNLPAAQWERLNPTVQAKLEQAMQAQASPPPAESEQSAAQTGDQIEQDQAQSLAAPAAGPVIGTAEAAPAFDVAGRSDAQLQHLATSGRPGWREAAQAEIARRAAPAAGTDGAASASALAQRVAPATTAQEDAAATAVQSPGPAAPAIDGRDLGDGWAAFGETSGTLGVPRAEMPQIRAEHRGAMVKFMNARGVAHREETVAAANLKPTQAEFNREKVAKAKARAGGERSILVSADGHVLDGHHQWLAAREAGEQVKAIRLDAPIRDLITLAHAFPSSSTADGAATAPRLGQQWDAMSADERTAAAVRAGWATKHGAPNVIAKRHAGKAWAALGEPVRRRLAATLAPQGAEAAAAATQAAPAFPVARSISPAPGTGRLSSVQQVRDAVAARLPGLAPSFDTMVARGTRGERGGAVVIEQADEASLAATFARHTGRSLAEARQDLQASLSAIKSTDANVRRGREALGKAVAERRSVHRAMYRNGLGWVDFVWGDAGRVKASGKSVGAMGLAHILEARQRKDGMTEADVLSLLDDLVTTIARGTEIRRRERDGTIQAVVAHGDNEAVLVRSKGNNAWLLSGWRVIPGAGRAANDAPGATHARADSSDAGMGAGLAKSIAQPMIDDNGALQGFYDPKSGLTFLVAPNLTAESAPAVLLHEVTHSQRRADIDAQALALIRDRDQIAMPAAARALLAEAEARMVAAGVEDAPGEATAYIVELATRQAKDHGFDTIASPFWHWVDATLGARLSQVLRDFVVMARQWGVRLGIAPKRITIDDLVAFAHAGVRAAAAGRVVTAAGPVQASRGPNLGGRIERLYQRATGQPRPDPNDPFRAENARLREQDKTLWMKAKRELRRWLTPGGLLPDVVFDQKVERDSNFQAVEFDVRHIVGGFERAVQGDFGARLEQLPEPTQRLLSEALAGKVPDSLPEGTRAAVVAMRQYIDGLSGEYLTILQGKIDDLMLQAQASGRSGDTEAAIREIELYEKIRGNLGAYVNRSYQAFDDPNWFRKVPTHVLNAARNYLADGYLEGGTLSEAEALRRADVAINEILKNGTAYDSMESFIAEGKLGAKDLSVLMRRKEVPPVIRALLGEYTDPRVNFTKSATKMGRLIWNQRFLDRVREIGVGTFLFEGTDRPPAATTQIAAAGSEVYAPLNGLWTFPEVAQAFKDALGKEQMGELYRFIVRANGLVKYGKTVLSPTTAMRNWQSAMFFTLANGHFDLTQMKKSVAAFREQVRQNATGDDLAYLRHLKELGVVYDTPYAGEMMRYIDDAKADSGLDALMRLFGASEGTIAKGLRGVAQINQMAQGFYSFGDDFWKIIGFENEKAQLTKGGLPPAEAEREAARRIRNTYPTYSMVGAGVRWLSRFPLMGTFVSFPAEIVRTSANMLRLTHADLKSDNPAIRAMGMKRAAGMAMVSGMFWALSALTKAMAGVADDEEEALRDLAPPWQKNSTFLYAGRDEQGNLRYFDMSFLDPYGYWKRPITAMLRDQPWEGAAASAIGDLLTPFFGADIATSAIFQVFANQKPTGGKVYQENATTLEQTADIADHLRKALQPGFVGNLERLTRAAASERREGSGQPYSLEDELVALLGWRASTMDPKSALYYRAFEFNDAVQEARQGLTRTLRSVNTVSGDDLRAARDTAQRRHAEAFTEMHRLVQAARAAGLTPPQIAQVLRQSGISQANAAALVRGTPPPLTISLQARDRAVQQALVMQGPAFAQEVSRRFNQAIAGRFTNID